MSLQAQIISLVSEAVGNPRGSFLSIRELRRVNRKVDSMITRTARRTNFPECLIDTRLAGTISRRLTSQTLTSLLSDTLPIIAYDSAGKFWARNGNVPFINGKATIDHFTRPCAGKEVVLLELLGFELPGKKLTPTSEESFYDLFLPLAKLFRTNKFSKDEIKKALSLNKFEFSDKDLDSIIKHLQSDQLFTDRLHVLFEHTQAPPYRSMWTHNFDTKPEIIPDIDSFRIELLDYFIKSVITPNSSARKTLEGLRHELSESFYYGGVTVEYGNPRDNLFDAIQSCINGIQGKSREAAIAYELDPEVEIIGMYPFANDYKLRQVVKAITVKTKDTDTDELKLVIDGVLANDDLDKILELDWRPIIFQGVINYAQRHEIKKIVLNTQNSTSHESASYFKKWIATTILGLQEGIDFECPLDSKTGRHNFVLNPRFLTRTLDVGDNKFKYTHNLRKKPMPANVIQELDNGNDYRGELYLDTWHNFNNFVRELGTSSRVEIADRFPGVLNFVEGRNVVWNQGCGPVIGLEIDVKQASA